MEGLAGSAGGGGEQMGEGEKDKGVGIVGGRGEVGREWIVGRGEQGEGVSPLEAHIMLGVLGEQEEHDVHPTWVPGEIL